MVAVDVCQVAVVAAVANQAAVAVVCHTLVAHYQTMAAVVAVEAYQAGVMVALQAAVMVILQAADHTQVAAAVMVALHAAVMAILQAAVMAILQAADHTQVAAAVMVALHAAVMVALQAAGLSLALRLHWRDTMQRCRCSLRYRTLL